MDKDSLEIEVWGTTVKANGTMAMVILALLLLLTVTVIFLFGGSQLNAIVTTFRA